MIASGQVDTKGLVTHRFKMSDTEKAFKTADDRDAKAIKVVIDCN